MRARRLAFFSVGVLMLASVLSCRKSTPTQPSPDCTLTITPTTIAFPSSGGTGTIALAIADGCAWVAHLDADWITFTGATTGNGAGTVPISVSPNVAHVTRTATFSAGGASIVIVEDAAAELPPPPPPECSYTVSPESASFSSAGGSGSVTVTAPAGCSWTAAASDTWIQISSGFSGSGSGTVQYAVPANVNVTDRSAVIVVADRTVGVTQSGNVAACLYTVSPVQFTPCMQSLELTTTITTSAGCPWTAVPSVNWMTVTVGASGAGSGVIHFTIGDNWDLPRTGVVMVRWPTITAGQNVSVSQAGCHYGVSQNAFSLDAGSHTQTFDVVQESDPQICGGPLQNACVWSAVSNAPWIVVNTTGSRTGDNPVSFTVMANATGATRAGAITVRDQVVNITQAAH